MNSLHLHIEKSKDADETYHVWRVEKASEYGPTLREEYEASNERMLFDLCRKIIAPKYGRRDEFDEIRITGESEDLEREIFNNSRPRV